VIGVLLRFLPLHLLAEAIRRVPVATFLAIVLGYLCAHTVGIAKWRMVVNAAGAQLDFRTSAQCYAGGLFGTLFFCRRLLAETSVRLAVGLRRSPNPAAVLAGNVADRFIDVAAASRARSGRTAAASFLAHCRRHCRGKRRRRCSILLAAFAVADSSVTISVSSRCSVDVPFHFPPAFGASAARAAQCFGGRRTSFSVHG